MDAYLSGLAAQDRFSGSVVVARKGTVLLRQGYGWADDAHKVPNSPTTRFGVGGVQGSFSMLGSLWLEDHGKLADDALICRYLPTCPASWQAITVGMVLDGTSRLPGFPTDTPGRTTLESLRMMQGEQMDTTPSGVENYQNGEVLVLSLIAQKITGLSWAQFLKQHIFGPVGMPNSGRVLSGAGTSFYAAYSTAPDVAAYDAALFGGKLLSPRSLHRLTTPRANAPAEPLGNTETQWGIWWKGGRFLGHRLIFTGGGGGGGNLVLPRR
jgi:CubicO group peptidase (beta-lactamase class C family)